MKQIIIPIGIITLIVIASVVAVAVYLGNTTVSESTTANGFEEAGMFCHEQAVLHPGEKCDCSLWKSQRFNALGDSSDPIYSAEFRCWRWFA